MGERKINLIFKETELSVDQYVLWGLSDLPVDEDSTRATDQLHIHIAWSEKDDQILTDLFLLSPNYIRVSPDEDEAALSIEVEPDPDIPSSLPRGDILLHIFPQARRNLLAWKPLKAEQERKAALANTEAVLGRLTTHLGKKVDTVESYKVVPGKVSQSRISLGQNPQTGSLVGIKTAASRRPGSCWEP